MSQPQPTSKLHLLFWTMATVALLMAGLASWALRQIPNAQAFPTASSVPPKRAPVLRPRYRPVEFEDLPGWGEDDILSFWPAFERSCDRWMRGTRDRSIEFGDRVGKSKEWRLACDGVLREGMSLNSLEKFFEAFQLSNHLEPEGLFTGYFEAHLRGSRVRTEDFRFPLFRRPPELVDVDLGRFRDSMKGQRLAGSLKGNRLEPFFDRIAIDTGALANRRLELAWVQDPVALFFLHIQGSGRLTLRDGREMRVGYAGQNGHPYYAIGRELIARGEISREAMSLQAIRQWLKDHPQESDSLMQTNASYVFFRELRGAGPVGSEGVALTPKRSMAVDRRFIPLGTPLWFEGEVPMVESPQTERWRRLMMAQDTGGAIKGVVRGDVFWGFGSEAEDRSGRMKHPGRLWILLPRSGATQEESESRGVVGL